MPSTDDPGEGGPRSFHRLVWNPEIAVLEDKRSVFLQYLTSLIQIRLGQPILPSLITHVDPQRGFVGFDGLHHELLRFLELSPRHVCRDRAAGK